jgi:DNA-binding SARP family transcriptional activator
MVEAGVVPPGEVIGARVRTPRVRALTRERVDSLFDRIWDQRLSLVVAPAGSGKTTALAQFAERSTHPVAWYRAEENDESLSDFLAHLARALTDALPGVAGSFDTVRSVVAALERWPGDRAAILIDDLHVLRGSPAEAAIGRLIDYLPPNFCLAATSRRLPTFDVSRLRLDGELLEIGTDDLRFRTWEVEQLFRDLYGTTLPPEDLARLTRRVEGWAAGLQLYHLAARSKPPHERRKLIDAVSSTSRLGREYLTRNVLDTLDDEVRTFLIDTCVLTVLTGPLCDELTGRNDSRALLEHLEREQMFTFALDEEGTYRYHEVLRSHLDALLVERDGGDGAQARYRQAATLLEATGFAAEALRCYSRGEDWAAVSRLVGEQNPPIASTGGWLDALPTTLVESDPWLVLARARGRAVAGLLTQSLADYQEAERLAGTTALSETSRQERIALAAWLDPMAAATGGWFGRLRQATRRDPLALLDSIDADDPGSLLAAGLAALIAGQLPRARQLLEDALCHRSTDANLSASAHLGLAITTVLRSGAAAGDAIEEAEVSAERAGVGWVARVARSALALTGRSLGPGEARRVRERCDADGDPWGAAIAALLEGLGLLAATEADALADAALEEAVRRFHGLDAPVLEALAASARSLARAQAKEPDARSLAEAAEHMGRQVQSPGARFFAVQALAIASEGSHADDHRRRAIELARECGFAVGMSQRDEESEVAVDPGPRRASRSLSAQVRCFGAFRIDVKGEPLEVGSVRPRARSVLRLLALHAPQPVHREVIMEALWPESEPEAALRNLQVALSSIRQLLPPDSGLAISRDGDAYRFVLPADARHDVTNFTNALAQARTARAANDLGSALGAATANIAAYSGELFTDEGPADWVVERREQFKADVVAAAIIAAEIALELERPPTAVYACERGLAIDRYSDSLWKLLARAHESAGDPVTAARSRDAYTEVMRELGVH